MCVLDLQDNNAEISQGTGQDSGILSEGLEHTRGEAGMGLE